MSTYLATTEARYVFTKEENRYCEKSMYTYTTIQMAKHMCELYETGDKCASVMDYKCDGEVGFMFCRDRSDTYIYPSDEGTCIYKKEPCKNYVKNDEVVIFYFIYIYIYKL